ncbi:site-specific integrase [Paraburkholderia kururiensis]|uniref:site-specific integrase n=1 Tax=Paraburkholderia kururiensis TaxID=984307 RepID=UPI0005A6D641|nr:site-specific integrase [Paraburkholderia kururiensis]
MATFTQRGNKWTAQIRIAGHPSVTKTFPKKAHAEQWAKRTETQMRDGAFQDERKLSNFTIGDLIDRYVNDVGGLRPFGKSKRGALDMLKRHLGATPVAKFSGTTVIEYAKARHQPRPKRGGAPGEMEPGAGPVTISVELSYLGTVFKIARALWGMPAPTQALDDARETLRHLGLIAKSKERDRRPTLDEIERICDFFDAKPRQRIPMRDIIHFAIWTTMRSSEITRLRWADLNEADRTIIIRDRKHPEEKVGNDQTVPLLGPAFDLVMRQPRRALAAELAAEIALNKDPLRQPHPDELIFPYRAATISSIFPRACEELKITDLHFHDLRHEGISRLFEMGYRIEQVALVSGHRDWKMLKRYTQVKAKDLHRPPHHQQAALSIAA